MSTDTTGLAILTGDDDDKNKPKAMNGSIVVVPKREVSVEELERAENELRAKAKKLFKDIEESYWDLGQCLYDVFDGVPGGYRALMNGEGARATRKALFDKWGFKSFAEYCEQEIGILKRSAENMRYAYYWFEIKLHLPKEVKERIKALGRSKCYLLSGFVGEDDVMSWLEKAQEMTHDELKKAIRVAKAAKADRNEMEGDTDLALAGGTRPGGSATGGSDGNDDEPNAPPKPEEMHQFHTSLYKGQWDTVQAALDRAKGMSHSDKIGHNLEMICTDFLSNNEFGKKPETDLKQYIHKMEKLLGLKLVAVDLKAGKPVYGGDLLWKLVQERVMAEKNGAGEIAEEPSNVTPIRGKKRKKKENVLEAKADEILEAHGDVELVEDPGFVEAPEDNDEE
jgi:hypothetical protein